MEKKRVARKRGCALRAQVVTWLLAAAILTAGGYLNLQSGFTYEGRNRLQAFNETVLSGGSSGGAWGQTNGYL